MAQDGPGLIDNDVAGAAKPEHDVPAALVEGIQAEAYAETGDAAPAALKAALGIRVRRIGGGVALAMPHDPTRWWSKTLGVGFEEPVTGSLVERVIDLYRWQGMPSATLMIAPSALPPDWADICARLGLREQSRIIKLVGDLRKTGSAAPTRLADGLRVGTVPPGQVDEAAAVLFAGMEFPAFMSGLVAGLYGRPGWHLFGVFEGDAVIAAGNLFVHETVALLFGGATLPAARGRGAQTALIAARIAAARELGCDWVTADTWPEAPGKHNPSLHNMLRAGMSVHYLRSSWTWGDPAPGVE
ncbi:MAG: hypothetical protein ACRDN0_34285 [Trebonia sp.]